ncbi:YdbH domain-containing protein [uncultured Microbulbifer sp.]|uniref:intermembrane phospholipid transport protein YdbH family protein n=1 Tax=uncultured Microbulbifer sp. TaxID=348147 RepID=UPI0026259EA6|nr:YdbH domain-containing protein [uncultured Microbulbifer sp.]
MRKSRIFFAVLTLVLIAFSIFSWCNREQVVSQLINLFYGKTVIQNISSLELGLSEISVNQIRLQPGRGDTVILDRVTISHPFHIIFSHNTDKRVDISIGKLTQHMGNRTGPTNALNTAEETRGYPAIYLSRIIQYIIRYMPDKVNINQIAIDKIGFMGSLEITRQHSRITVKLPYKLSQKEEYSLSLQADVALEKIKLNVNLDSNKINAISYTDITILKKEHGGWIFDSNMFLNLDSISPVINTTVTSIVGLSPEIHTRGTITIRTTSDIPDNITAISGYRNISLEFESENLKADFHSKLLDTMLEAKLSITTPVELKFSALDPLIPEYITGSGSLNLFPTGNLSEQNFLLDFEFEPPLQTNIPDVLVNGSVNFSSDKILTNSPLWKRAPTLASLKNQNGRLNFYGEINLQPLDQLSSAEKNVLDRFTLTLSPESQVSFIVPMQNFTEGSPLQPFGFDKSRVQVEIEDSLTITGVASQSNQINLAVDGGTVSIGMKGEKSNSSIQSHFRKIQCKITDSAECAFEIEAEIPEIVNPTSGISIIQLFSAAKVHVKKIGDKHRLQVKQFKLTAKEIKDRSLHLKNSELFAPDINCVFHRQKSSCNSTEWNSNLTAIFDESPSLSGDVNFSNLKLQIDDGKTDFSSTYNSKNLHLTTLEKYAVDASLSGFVSLTDNVLEGKGNLVSGSLIINSHLQHNLKQTKGSILFSLPPVDFSPMHPLSQTVKGLPIDVISGQISANGTLSWPQQQDSAIQLSLSDIATVYADSFATGIHGQLLLKEDNGQWITAGPQTLSVESIDAGMPLEKIHFSLVLDREKDLVLRNFTAEFLDGEMTSKALTWNLSHKKRQSKLYVQDISLEQLARITESKHFEAKGRLNLTIPIVTGADGITVENGQIRALAPGGQLRYYGAFSAQMLADNPQLILVSNALEDYLYRTLEGNMEYSPKGDLQLKLKLVGRSDSVDTDRDLIINLNLENNIPAMLHSLQSSRDMAEALKKQLDQ